MAKTTKKTSKTNNESESKLPSQFGRQTAFVIGVLLVLISIGMFVAFVSFFIHGKTDQSAVTDVLNRNEVVQNWLGKFGAYIADFFIYKGFGVASFLFIKVFFISGMYLILGLSLKKLKSSWFWDLYMICILSILCGFFFTTLPELGGVIGFEMNLFFQD
jgi:S-DNA-T family DNA segregation ATPase FtsK/SpoIIIE